MKNTDSSIELSDSRVVYAMELKKILPVKWTVYDIGKICKIQTGKLDVNQADEGGKYPFFTCAEKIYRINTPAFDTEAVLVAGNGFFNVKYYKGKFNAYQRTYVLTDIDIDGKYLYYYTNYRLPDITLSNRGSTIRYIRLGDLRDYPVVVAPPDEQKLIVAEIEKQFSRLDEAVAALKRIKANLKRYKASVLKAAVEGKLTEEWRKEHPDVEPASELLKRILVERRRKWEEAYPTKMYKEPGEIDKSKLNALHKGWVWASLEMITDAIGGYAFKSKEFSDSGHQIIKMANIKMETLDLSQRPAFMSDVPDDIVVKYQLVDGDILITLTGTRKKRDYGYVVQIKEPNTSLLLNQRIARLRPYLCELSSFLSMVLQSEVYRDRFFSYETGNVGQGNVGMKAITIESIPFPPLEEQLTIMRDYSRNVSVANNIERDVDNNLKRADRLHQSILNKAFSGQLVPRV
ncbi:MAG: restriction endonuclease subunit S [Candidatus Brocadiales bacterium]|nr:restriction endonuclease subunit S [Candidatus Brocadiales bacterium]